MNLRPLRDRILVKRLEREEKTAGGLILPDEAQEISQKGLVIATGEGKISSTGVLIKMIIKEGDTVFFGKYSGTETDKDHLIIKEDEVLGVIDKS